MEIRCAVCGDWFNFDGREGLFPHLLREHPQSGMGQAVLGYLSASPGAGSKTRFHSD